jgi:hypothetical protein
MFAPLKLTHLADEDKYRLKSSLPAYPIVPSAMVFWLKAL